MSSVLPVSRHTQIVTFQAENPSQKIRRLLNRFVTASNASESEYDDHKEASNAPLVVPDVIKEEEDTSEEWVTDKIVVDVDHSTASLNLPATPSLTDVSKVKNEPEFTESSGIAIAVWAHLSNFFSPVFSDPAQEQQFQKERWYNTKAMSWFACVFIVINWILFLIFNRSHTLYEKIVYYGIATVVTIPLPVLVALDVPRHYNKTYQLFIMISTWIWPIAQVIETKLCHFYPSAGQTNQCNGKDFLFMMVYSIALPALALFGCNQKRLYATIGSIIQFCLLCALFLPTQKIFVRNVVFFILLHYFQEKIDRRMFVLRLQLKLSYRAQQKAQNAQKQASDSKKRHVSYIFHEVRVPLNSAMLAFQNMQSNEGFKTLAHDQAVEIQALSDSMLAMKQVLDDALDLERMDSGQFLSVAQPFPFHRSIESMLGPSLVACAIKNLRLNVDLDPRIEALSAGHIVDGEKGGEREGSWVVGDPLRLRQVLTNLTSNAVKFSPQGGGTVSVKTILVTSPSHPNDSSSALSTAVNAETTRPKLPPRRSSLFKTNQLSELPADMQAFETEERRKKSAVVIRVEISDCGPGIKPSESKRLFSAFFQTRLGAMQAGGGSGLGLAIVKQIISLSGGRLGVHSRKNVGSTFWFEMDYMLATSAEVAAQRHSTSENMDTLVAIVTSGPLPKRLTLAEKSIVAAVVVVPPTLAPLLIPSLETLETVVIGLPKPIPIVPLIVAAKLSPLEPSSSFLGLADDPLQVLVVDDEPITRLLLARMLKRLGCEVTTAADGAQALAILLDTGASDSLVGNAPRYFDLISLDNAMPVITGEEAVRKFRALGRNDFVVGATGNALREDQEAYLAAGADYVLAKPVMLKDLKAMLQIARQRRQTSRKTPDNRLAVGEYNSRRPRQHTNDGEEQ